MKTLIAVESCARDLHSHDVIRETWGRDVVGADLRFFVGAGNGALKPDEVRLNAPDDYDGLTLKTKALAQWAVQNGYDAIFKMDTDTFIVPARLLACGFERYDYVGKVCPGGAKFNGSKVSGFLDWRNVVVPEVWPYMSGLGYWLSRRAAELVVNMPIVHWAEDLCVGQVLGPHISDGKLTTFVPERYEGYCVWHGGDDVKKTSNLDRWLRFSYARGEPRW